MCTSNLKCDDPKLRKETLSNRACTLCDFGIDENTVHLVMQCPYHEATRICMYNDIDKLQVETYGISGTIYLKGTRHCNGPSWCDVPTNCSIAFRVIAIPQQTVYGQRPVDQQTCCFKQLPKNGLFIHFGAQEP